MLSPWGSSGSGRDRGAADGGAPDRTSRPPAQSWPRELKRHLVNPDYRARLREEEADDPTAPRHRRRNELWWHAVVLLYSAPLVILGVPRGPVVYALLVALGLIALALLVASWTSLQDRPAFRWLGEGRLAVTAGAGFLWGCSLTAQLIFLWPDSRPPVSLSLVLITLAGGVLFALGTVGIAAWERRRQRASTTGEPRI